MYGVLSYKKLNRVWELIQPMHNESKVGMEDGNARIEIASFCTGSAMPRIMHAALISPPAWEALGFYHAQQK